MLHDFDVSSLITQPLKTEEQGTSLDGVWGAWGRDNELIFRGIEVKAKLAHS